MNNFLCLLDIQKQNGLPGLSQDDGKELLQQANLFIGIAPVFDSQLDSMLNLWHSSGHLLAPTTAPAQLRSTLQSLIDALQVCVGTATQLHTCASTVKAESIALTGKLDRAITENQRSQANAHQQIRTMELEITQQKEIHRQAQAELDGGKGFLNGFLTGITLGIYNPVKSNLKKSAAAIVRLNQAILVISQTLNAIAKLQQQMTQSKNTLSRLNTLQPAMTACQNAINTGLKNLQEADNTIGKASNNDRPKVIDIYLGKARQDIDRIISWKNSLSTGLCHTG